MAENAIFTGQELSFLFDIVLTMPGPGAFDEEIENSILVDLGGLPVRIMTLDRIIKSKETVGRPKDRLMAPVLRDVLATIKERDARKGAGRKKKRRAGQGR